MKKFFLFIVGATLLMWTRVCFLTFLCFVLQIGLSPWYSIKKEM